MNTASFLPITLLAVIGTLLVVLGVFVSGEIEMVAMGLIALAIAGVLGVLVDRRR